jgi:hypothetical protein
MEKSKMNPLLLITKGWHYEETKDLGGGLGKHDICKMEHKAPDNYDDAESFYYTLYVPAFHDFRTWDFANFIIERKTTGGFFGIERTETIYNGRIPTEEDYDYLCKLLNIKK